MSRFETASTSSAWRQPSAVIKAWVSGQKTVLAKPPKSVREAPAKGVGLVKGQVKSGTKRKSA